MANPLISSSLIGIGLSSAVSLVQFKPKRKIGPITALVTVEEDHEDELVITEHPMEQSAIATDHTYKRPATVNLVCGWSDSVLLLDKALQGLFADVRSTYEKLLELQESAVPFVLYTGKRVYRNMLIASLRTRTDSTTENSLIVSIRCQQVLIVSTSEVSVPVPPEDQAQPEDTQQEQKAGTKQPKRSILKTVTDGFSPAPP